MKLLLWSTVTSHFVGSWWYTGRLLAISTIKVREKLRENPIDHIVLANELQGWQVVMAEHLVYGKENMVQQRSTFWPQLCTISYWSLKLHFTSLSFHLLFYVMFSSLQKIKRECRWFGAWHSASAQKYQFPLSLRISPSERWMALTRWLRSGDAQHSCSPSGSTSASSMQKTLRPLWSPKRERCLGGRNLPTDCLGVLCDDKVSLVQTLKLWNLFVLAASSMLNNLLPSPTDHILAFVSRSAWYHALPLDHRDQPMKF